MTAKITEIEVENMVQTTVVLLLIASFLGGVNGKDCDQQSKELKAIGLLDTFQPQCNPDGTYKAKQFDGSATFRAAVYEHAVKDVVLSSLNPTRAEIWKALSVNIDPLTKAVTEAKTQGADIVLFPEYGITGFNFLNRSQIYPLLEDIPASDSRAIPCNTFPNHTIQHWLSCLAKNNKIYIAANVGDVKKCIRKDVNCPSDGVYQYNTNVVYNQDGMIVHRYHKINLYGWEVKFMDYGKVGQKNLVFNTPFGRMSSMVCFDIAMKEPGVPLTTAGKIDTMLFLTAWMNRFPHFTSIQYHSSWAMRHKVNVLSSETHRPSIRMTGSGLYSPTGAVKYTYDMNTDKPKLLVADMPIKPKTISMQPSDENQNNEIKWMHPQFASKYYNFAELTGSSGKASVCKGNICCKAEYTFSTNSSGKELYAVGASYLPVYHKQGTLEICVVLKCAQKKKDGCGLFVSDTTATFDLISLSGNFSGDQVHPSASLYGFRLAEEGQFDMSSLGQIKTRIQGLPVVTMVLLGRNYDGESSAASPIIGNSFTQVAHVVIAFVITKIVSLRSL